MYEHKHSATHHRNLFDSIYMYLFYWHKFRVMSDQFGLLFYKNILNSLLSFIHMDFFPQRTLYLCLQITCLNRDVFFVLFFSIFDSHEDVINLVTILNQHPCHLKYKRMLLMLLFFLWQMIKQNSGNIINMSSVASSIKGQYISTYLYSRSYLVQR